MSRHVSHEIIIIRQCPHVYFTRLYINPPVISFLFACFTRAHPLSCIFMLKCCFHCSMHPMNSVSTSSPVGRKTSYPFSPNSAIHPCHKFSFPVSIPSPSTETSSPVPLRNSPKSWGRFPPEPDTESPGHLRQSHCVPDDTAPTAVPHRRIAGDDGETPFPL